MRSTAPFAVSAALRASRRWRRAPVRRTTAALSLALAIVGGIAAGMRCDASVTVETPTQINPRVAAYTVRAYTEGTDPFVPNKHKVVNKRGSFV